MKMYEVVGVAIISLAFAVQQTTANTQPQTANLAKSRYSDPNGYFRIVPPEGWQIQKYPRDPRGKVAFIGPDGAELRILAKGLDYNTFEEMVDEIKGIEKKIGTNTNIERITFAGKPAVKRKFILKGTKVLFIDFMIANTTHNLMYSASPPRFEKYLRQVQESIDTYEPTLRGVSSEDVKNHTIAKCLRLSELFAERSNYKLALEYVDEGLKVAPNHKTLLNRKSNLISSAKDNDDTETSNNVPGGEADSGISDEDDNNLHDDPGLAFIIALIGAFVVAFSQDIAESTAWPGFARITTPLIGGGVGIFGLGQLFEGDHMFLGVVAILSIMVIVVARLWFEIHSSKAENQE